MSDYRFTTRDGLILTIMLGILSALTLLIWIPLQFLTSIDASVSDIYVLSCLLLLAAHLIRQRTRSSRRERNTKESNRS